MPFPPGLRDLSPPAAKLCLSAERFFLSLGPVRNARLLAAVSGGADSMALALVLRILAPRLNLQIFALTVNHGLLPEAEFIAARVAAQCAVLGIDCAVKKAAVSELATAGRIGLEEAGRKLRYRLLEEERAARQAHYIALAHQRADLAEDVLMRLTRGSGWPALGGMKAGDGQRRILRPLLFADPQSLKKLLRECGIDWFEDPSNQDLRFKRNRIRHSVIPLLKEENPALDKSVARLWQLARTDEDYWKKILDVLMDKIQRDTESGDILLPAVILRGLHPAVRLRLYHRALALPELAGEKGGNPARAETLFALDAAFEQRRNDCRFQLPGGIAARPGGQGIIFSRAELSDGTVGSAQS